MPWFAGGTKISATRRDPDRGRESELGRYRGGISAVSGRFGRGEDAIRRCRQTISRVPARTEFWLVGWVRPPLAQQSAFHAVRTRTRAFHSVIESGRDSVRRWFVIQDAGWS